MCLNRKNPKLVTRTNVRHQINAFSKFMDTYFYLHVYLQICKYTSKILPNIGPNIRPSHMSMLALKYKKWINKPQSSHINFLMAIDLTAQAKIFRR